MKKYDWKNEYNPIRRTAKRLLSGEALTDGRPLSDLIELDEHTRKCLAFEATLTDRQIDMLQELGYLPVIMRQYGEECANCPYTLDEQTARMKAIKQLYDSSAAFQRLKPVYDGLQKIKFEKPRAKYKAEHEAKLKQFYAARRKLTGEFPDGKVDMKKLTEEYDELEQAHNTTYGEFKTVRDDLHRLWKVKSCVDTAARFNERTEEQMHQNRPQTRHKKEDISR